MLVYLVSSMLFSPTFQVEKSPKPKSRRPSFSGLDPEYLLRDCISKFLAVKSQRVSCVTGSIPYDSSQLVLFFRTKSGISHALDFPIEVEFSAPPALDVLIAACRPHQTSDLNDYAEQESLFYPVSLPLTTSLELANHPVMEAIRDTLFPSLPVGHYLTAVRDKLEVLVSGSRLAAQPRSLRNDSRVATIIVTLPVSFRGGALVIHDTEGHKETFSGTGVKSGELEWTAFLADCDYEVEPVQKGCKMFISYSVFLRTFGPSGIVADPLIHPSDKFFELLSPVLTLSRGRKIAFYLSNTYSVNPAEVLAESLVPHLKAGDSILYHALKLYKLAPELHWYAGGYIWPVDRTIDFSDDDKPAQNSGRLPLAIASSPYTPALRGTFSVYGDAEKDDEHSLRSKVEGSGAIPLADAEISILTDWNSTSPVEVGKERVPFASGGNLDKLVVNTLVVVYVP